MKLFIDNAPSFYRVNMFNLLVKKTPLAVVYTEQTNFDKSRNEDFYGDKELYESTTLSKNPIVKVIEVFRYMRTHDVEETIIGEWVYWGDWLFLLFSPKKKNSCVIESSVFESKTTGLKGFIKRLFLKRCSRAYVAGKNQEALAKALNYRGEIIVSGGCGILNYVPQPPYEERSVVKSFIYVGRFVEVKNLELLVDAFNQMPDLELQLVGFGELESELRKRAEKNISFVGAIDNKDMWQYYRKADVFVLPSKSEPWGLVVEEALNNGTPVIVSDMVGCKDDFVTEETGLVFQHDSVADLINAVRKITDISYYNTLRYNISKMDFQERAEMQIRAFEQ